MLNEKLLSRILKRDCYIMAKFSVAGILRPLHGAKTDMTQFDTMTRRAMGKYWRRAAQERKFDEMGPATVKMARALLAAQKGRRTLFKGPCRPGFSDIVQEILQKDLPKLAKKLAAPWSIQEMKGAGLSGKFDSAHPCWDGYKELGYASLHDAFLERWERSKSSMEIVFNGWFDNGSDESKRVLLMRFEFPKVRLLWDGAWVGEPGLGIWTRDAKNEKFILRNKTRRGQRGNSIKSLGLGGLGWVDADEVSQIGEESQELRFCFSGAVGRLECAVAFESVELFWGSEAIESQRLKKILDAHVESEGCSEGVKGPRL